MIVKYKTSGGITNETTVHPGLELYKVIFRYRNSTEKDSTTEAVPNKRQPGNTPRITSKQTNENHHVVCGFEKYFKTIKLQGNYGRIHTLITITKLRTKAIQLLAKI